jgi:hypothetical protein
MNHHPCGPIRLDRHAQLILAHEIRHSIPITAPQFRS